MLQSSSGIYTGHYGMHPYQGYIPFETIEEQEEFRLVTRRKSNPLFVYCKYKLEQWVKTYRQCRQKIKWHFWHGDALNLALFHMPLIEFDLIHTSNLCDHVGMLNLLITCINLLRNRLWSRILTQSMSWRIEFARFSDYSSQLFNTIELSWFPSLLGLICECTRTIGLVQKQEKSFTIKKFNLTDSYEYQIWRLPTNRYLEPHLRLDGTDINILQVLDKIAERCFYVHLTKPEAYKGIGHSTTLTYYLLLRQYCLRCCVNPDESFDYLFQRTCDRFRAYATGLRSLRDFFTVNNHVNMYTSKDHRLPITDSLMSAPIQTPVLQILILECDEKTTHAILTAMHTDTFKETNKTSVVGKKIRYDLSSGTITFLSDSQQKIKFHLIDDFAFKLVTKPTGVKPTQFDFFMNLGNDAQIQFILPTTFLPSSQTALLIDTHTWFPFAKFRLMNPFTICSISAFKAFRIRDAVSSCYADISDRKIYYSKSKKKVQVLNAYETTSSYHIQIKIEAQSSSWKHIQDLILSEHALNLTIKFSSSDICLLRLVFACPLDLNQSKFQSNVKDGTLNILLEKNTAELLSLTTFSREATMTVLFDSKTAKRWPYPRLADGRLLDIACSFPESTAVGGYDSETMIVHDALTNMFTFSELILAQRQSGDHLQRDADFDLRESIKHMYLFAFCGRQRLTWYTTKTGKPESANDIRTCGDILFLFEGVYNFSSRPVLAVSYLDMMDIIDANINYFTQYIKNLITAELNIYATTIAKTRSVPQILLSDFNVMKIVASKQELNLMRQFLLQNRAKTKDTHRNNLYGPWYASFVEPLLSDSRSRLLSTNLTRESGISLESTTRHFFQCEACKKMPPDPKTLWPKCGQCKKVNYCSRACQTRDWSNHKQSCQH